MDSILSQTAYQCKSQIGTVQAVFRLYSQVLHFFRECVMIKEMKGGTFMNIFKNDKSSLLRRCVLLLVLPAVLLIVVSCGGNAVPETTTESSTEAEPLPPSVTLADKDKNDCTIVFARGGEGVDRALEFKNLIAKTTGIQLQTVIDTSRAAEDDATEIVIGRTNRDELFGEDLDLLVSDAYVIRLSGNRLLICAASNAGYARAFADFFKLTLQIDDLEHASVQSDATISLHEGFSLFVEPSLTTEQNKTLSGISYTPEGQTGGAYNYLQFDSALTYRFPTAVGETFNYYSIRYSSDTYLSAQITYSKDGKDYTEQLYLEPGERMSFDSFCDGAVDGTCGAAISSLSLTPIRPKSSEFMLEDIGVSMREIPEEVVYISSDRYRLGIKLAWGGGISYLEDLKDGDASLTNLLNDHDTGRLVQQSYYGTASAPYTPAQYNGTVWSYNPVQGGDQYNHRSKLVDWRISEDGQSIYVKCRPLDWAQNNVLTPSYMENTYTIADGLIRVDNRFVDFSGYTHREAHQELPAFYTVSYLSDFVYYTGKNAFSEDALTVKKDLPFWGGNSGAYFDLSCAETWGAWVSPEGYGIGVYTPIAEMLLAGRHAYNGSKSAGNNATNYVAPLITQKMKTLEPFAYSYYITTGNTEEIRDTFRAVWRENG